MIKEKTPSISENDSVNVIHQTVGSHYMISGLLFLRFSNDLHDGVNFDGVINGSFGTIRTSLLILRVSANYFRKIKLSE